MPLKPIYLVSGVRTAIGDFGGALKSFKPDQLATAVLGEAITRANLKPEDIGHVIIGQVIQSEPRDAYLARISAVNAGIPVGTPALKVTFSDSKSSYSDFPSRWGPGNTSFAPTSAPE